MQAPRVQVICEQEEIRSRLLQTLHELGGIDLHSERAPDLVCIGCRGELSLRDLECARKWVGTSNAPMVLVAWEGSEELAIQALRHGIRDYVRGDASTAEFGQAVRSLCGSREEPSLAAGGLLVGDSAATRATRAYVARVAKTSSNVLITGETGTGKELIAELIHRNSSRAHKAMVCINCAAIPDSLLESELFGFERGAFTGAHAAQDGKFKAADGGTIFLDEIGDMSPYAQAKVLRVIESHQVQRLGSHRPQQVDFRIVAATNRDLERLAHSESFRRDLFFRLNVARVHLSPLRERPDDLLALAHHFRRVFNASFGRNTVGFALRAEQAILRHSWPGNGRELRNMVEAAFINLDPGSQWVEFPELFCATVESGQDHGEDEVNRILRALAQTRWNKSKAAQILQCSRMTLYRKMERYGILEAAVMESPSPV